VYIIGATVPASATHRFTQENLAARTVNWVGGYIRTLGTKPVLAIDNNAGLEWFLYRKPSINPAALANRPEAFLYHYKRQTFPLVIAVQRMAMDLATNHRFVSADDDLGPGIQLETIDEKTFAPTYMTRISRVVGVDETKLLAWAKERRKLTQDNKLIPVPATMNVDELGNWVRQLP
jgi:hypothetical protein